MFGLIQKTVFFGTICRICIIFFSSGQTRLPLRDAVERRIVPSDILTSSELDDVRSDVQFRYSHYSPYSPLVRFQDVINLPVAPPLFVVPQPYRIDNPYQQIVDISQARRGGIRGMRRARSGQFARFDFANRNLEGKYNYFDILNITCACLA